MKYTILSILVGLIIALIVGWSVYEDAAERSNNSYQTETDSSTITDGQSTTVNATSGPSESTTNTSAEGITMATITEHNSRSSCWATINGSVYDLTSWIPHHPGGEQAILQLCGTDGSAKFNRQHGSNNRVLTVLAGFKIGTLTQ